MNAQDPIVQDYKNFLAEYRKRKAHHSEKSVHTWHSEHVKLMIDKWGQSNWEEAREFYFSHPGQC